MTILSGISYKRISATMLSVIVLAWLILAAIPCAKTAISEAPGRVAASGPTLEDACPGVKPLQSAVDSDCCCLLNALVNVDAPKLPKVAMLVPVPANPVFIDPLLVNVLMIDPGHAQADDPFPPVYLTTRRLRI